MVAPVEILRNLFSFIINDTNKDLDPDHYQLVFHQQGLGITLTIRYIQGKDKERELGRLGI